MKAALKLKRTLQALLVAGISIFALAPVYAAGAPKVTADNYVRAESDVQMKGYIESLDCFGKFHHNRQPYDVDNQVTIRFGGDPKADNFLPIVPGWNYIVRLYRPKQEVLDGSWAFPSPQAVE